MTNAYSGIISEGLKNLFTNSISALLYDDSLTTPCTLYYGTTKYEDCVNCIYDPVGQKSSNKFQDGGPVPFPFQGICPMCNGAGKRGVESTEDMNLMVIWDYKEFMGVGTVNNPDGIIQTLTFADRTPQMKRAKEIVVATNLSSYATHRFERMSEPEPCGLDSTEFITCLWRRSG